MPIFQPIIEAVWADNVAPKTPLSGPSPQARRDLVDVPIDYMSGNRMNGGNFIEHFRRSADGQVADTQYQLMSQDDAYAYQGGESNPFWGGAADNSHDGHLLVGTDPRQAAPGDLDHDDGAIGHGHWALRESQTLGQDLDTLQLHCVLS